MLLPARWGFRASTRADGRSRSLLRGRRDFGCFWGYLGALLLDHGGVYEVHGVDLKPWWQDLTDGTRPEEIEGLHLYAGDLRSIPALQSLRFDIIVSLGTLMVLEPTTMREYLRWFYEHLNPGGHCALEARTFFSDHGGDLHPHTPAPIPHLLFAKRITDDFVESRGGEPRYMAPFCAATYLMLYRRVGFEILWAERIFTDPPNPAWARFDDKLSMYDPTELATDRLQVLLRKPEREPDGSTIARAFGASVRRDSGPQTRKSWLRRLLRLH